MISERWRKIGVTLDSIALGLFIANVVINICKGNISATIGWTMAASFLLRSMFAASDSRYWYRRYCSSIGILPES